MKITQLVHGDLNILATRPINELASIDGNWVKVIFKDRGGSTVEVTTDALGARQFAYMFSEGASRADGKPPASYGKTRPR